MLNGDGALHRQLHRYTQATMVQLAQEFLAQMLGVRRATMSLTAGLLHNAGLISYRRGVITIDDREGLREAACDCYDIVHGAFDQLSPRTDQPA